mmetsp:Transcript_14777/g.43381  ORF Transcript_14777/g.43381 Transcript_14777/m.43381 type:complete len:207 (-) Transcript_14777:1967-2587(-)
MRRCPSRRTVWPASLEHRRPMRPACRRPHRRLGRPTAAWLQPRARRRSRRIRRSRRHRLQARGCRRRAPARSRAVGHSCPYCAMQRRSPWLRGWGCAEGAAVAVGSRRPEAAVQAAPARHYCCRQHSAAPMTRRRTGCVVCRRRAAGIRRRTARPRPLRAGCRPCCRRWRRHPHLRLCMWLCRIQPCPVAQRHPSIFRRICCCSRP